MNALRRVALVFDPLRLDRAQRELLAGIRRYAARTPAWHCVLDPDAATHLPDSPYALPGPYHGLLALARRQAALRIARARVPAVVLTWGAYRVTPLTRVAENRWEAGRLAAAHLLERGCRTFGYVGFAKQTASRLERDGFRRWLVYRGRPCTVCRVPLLHLGPKSRWRSVRASLGQWLGRLIPPAGIFVTRDHLAYALADLARERGLRVPEDIALIGSGNDVPLCEAADPPLSSIEFHLERVGTRAAEVLDRLMNREVRLSRRTVLVKPTLVPRRSTDRGGVADPVVARALYWIETHSNEAIRPGDVARAVGLSQRQLERRMHASRGGTILREIARARLDHARLLLEMGDDPPAVIAHLVGFRSRWNLAAAFRRHLGTTPTEYRKQHPRPPRPGAPDVSFIFHGPP
jgi:LacI family transcriptional regulator